MNKNIFVITDVSKMYHIHFKNIFGGGVTMQLHQPPPPHPNTPPTLTLLRERRFSVAIKTHADDSNRVKTLRASYCHLLIGRVQYLQFRVGYFTSNDRFYYANLII